MKSSLVEVEIFEYVNCHVYNSVYKLNIYKKMLNTLKHIHIRIHTGTRICVVYQQNKFGRSVRPIIIPTSTLSSSYQEIRDIIYHLKISIGSITYLVQLLMVVIVIYINQKERYQQK